MKKNHFLILLISAMLVSCMPSYFNSTPLRPYEGEINRIYILFETKNGYDFAIAGMVDQFSESFNNLNIPVSVEVHTEGQKWEKSYIESAKELEASLILRVKQTMASGKLSKVDPNLSHIYPNSGTRNESSFEFTLLTLNQQTIWRGNGDTSFGAIHDPDGGRTLANKVINALKKDGVI